MKKLTVISLFAAFAGLVSAQTPVVVSAPSEPSNILGSTDGNYKVFSMEPVARPMDPDVVPYDTQDVALVPILDEPTPLGSDFHETFLSVKRILRADFNATTSQYVEVFYPVYWYEDDLRLSVNDQTKLYEMEMELQVVLGEYRDLRNRMVSVLEGFYDLYKKGQPSDAIRNEVLGGLQIYETLIDYAPTEGLNNITIEPISTGADLIQGNQIPTIQINRTTGAPRQ
jgi:hypothetical protein